MLSKSNSSLVKKLKSAVRGVCFDESTVRRLLQRKLKLSYVEQQEVELRKDPYFKWAPGAQNEGDGLFCGSTVEVGMRNYFIVARTTRTAVVLRDENCGQISTVKATDLPLLTSSHNEAGKQRAINILLDLFDPATVEKVTIEQPDRKGGPRLFDEVKDGDLNGEKEKNFLVDIFMKKDVAHSYLPSEVAVHSLREGSDPLSSDGQGQGAERDHPGGAGPCAAEWCAGGGLGGRGRAGRAAPVLRGGRGLHRVAGDRSLRG